MAKQRVALGMSGGVDSSVAAFLLQREGYDVVGIHMKVDVGMGETTANACFLNNEEGIKRAESVAKKIGIPFHIIDVTADFQVNVLDYFSKEYCSGKTPNPCVECNRFVKFGALLNNAKNAGIAFDLFATGHYVIKHNSNKNKRVCLRKANDSNKDQSYFLYGLSQKKTTL